jgi:hypothetical protein
MPELAPSTLAKLAQSRLTAEDAELLQIHSIDADEAATRGFAPRGGFVIPYFDLDGKPTSFCRVRYIDPPKPNGFKALPSKPQKYAQLPGTLNEVYLPPFVDWRAVADDTEVPIFVTEGELKSACATRLGLPTLGLGGVWNFRAAKQNILWLPQLDEIKWSDRTVFIVFDSDAVNNPMVRAAESAIGRMLLEKGAKPLVVRLPEETKGFDDWIVARGIESIDELTDQLGTLPTDPVDQLSVELHRLNEEVVAILAPPCVMALRSLDRIRVGDFLGITHSDRIVREVNAKGQLVAHSAAKKWLQWPGRAKAQGLDYRPGEPQWLDDGRINLWRGWGCTPKTGDVAAFEEFVKFAGLSEWFVQWLAYPLQHPGAKLHSAVVLWGAETGTGKSLLGEVMTSIYGDNATAIDDSRLNSRFNSWAANKSFVVGEEITGAESRQLANKVKDMITRRTLRIEQKGLDTYELIDHCNYLLLSNMPDAFRIDRKDRRFYVHEMPERKLPPKIIAGMKALKADPSALFEHLLHIDLATFDPHGEPPMTTAKLEMICDSQSDVESWIMRHLPNLRLASAEELLHAYEPDATRRRIKANGMTRSLKLQGYRHVYGGAQIRLTNGTQVRLFAIAADAKDRQWLLQPRRTVTELREIYETEHPAGSKPRYK